MNLITIKQQLEKKDQKRNQLLGQKEMLMESLNKTGFKTVKEALKAVKKKEKKKKELIQLYQEKENSFLEKYEDLLND